MPRTARSRSQLRHLRLVVNQLHQFCEAALELRVAPGRIIVRSVFDLDVGLGAAIFYVPAGIVEPPCKLRLRGQAAVRQPLSGMRRNADDAAVYLAAPSYLRP